MVIYIYIYLKCYGNFRKDISAILRDSWTVWGKAHSQLAPSEDGKKFGERETEEWAKRSGLQVNDKP